MWPGMENINELSLEYLEKSLEENLFEKFKQDAQTYNESALTKFVKGTVDEKEVLSRN